jgi:hypothetical protein
MNPIHRMLTLDSKGATLFPEAALKSKFTRPCAAYWRGHIMRLDGNKRGISPDFGFLESMK